MSLTEKIQTEEKTYQCPSNNHLGSDRELFVLNYLNGHESLYRFCEPCFALYSIETGNPEYVDVNDKIDNKIESLPVFIYKNKEGKDVKLDPIDLIAGDPD